jgi:hypothetical protein
MKKLTPERKGLALAAIESARQAQQSIAVMKAENSNFTHPEWRGQMNIVWAAQHVLMDDLGLSMTRALDLIDGKTTLADYFDPTGTPIKGVVAKVVKR